MRSSRAWTLVIAVAAVAPGCTDPGAEQPAAAPPASARDGRPLTRHVDGPARLAFDLPASGYRLAAEHFPRDTPPRKIKDLLTVVGPQGVAVTVDVWHNPAGLALAPWFERHLAFMRAPLALETSGAVTPARVPAIFIQQPRSEQAAGRDAAVFAVGTRVFRVTCHDRDDARSVAVYERVLATFAPEPTP